MTMTMPLAYGLKQNKKTAVSCAAPSHNVVDTQGIASHTGGGSRETLRLEAMAAMWARFAREALTAAVQGSAEAM
eukprot:1361954-Heterocapsa_arctica.AAC.1